MLVTNCPGCYRTFKHYYPNLLNIEMPCEVLHVTQLLQSLNNRQSMFKKELTMRATYHDPCALKQSGVYEAPRRVLNEIPGLQIIEMASNKELSRCCGGGGGLWAINPSVTFYCALRKIKEDIFPLNARFCITSCPQCYTIFNISHLKVHRTLIEEEYSQHLLICKIKIMLPDED